ncbi:DUF4157 domain-containing protein [Paucibacter sp. APW11]|uniref:DUF4157 domain-containing protein n=1 Tax=Roseateles aquae TaxID=3077235 RepID=A0ABU3P6K3_9BURK|nr:DUF4157 domain-containing protein [Paucibacter sp. APW11]MDT8998214.1 DUF4157 domain-containing protein [Paucibacter sp. APW11]
MKRASSKDGSQLSVSTSRGPAAVSLKPAKGTASPPPSSPRQRKQALQLAQLQGGGSAASHASAGLPEPLRGGIEAMSGIDMSGVRVHRNSSKPAALQAHAFAQGRDIHLGPGQEKHLPHEAWHVVQQAQGRVRPTLQMAGGVGVNTDAALEAEASSVGARAQGLGSAGATGMALRPLNVGADTVSRFASRFKGKRDPAPRKYEITEQTLDEYIGAIEAGEFTDDDVIETFKAAFQLANIGREDAQFVEDAWQEAYNAFAKRNIELERPDAAGGVKKKDFAKSNPRPTLTVKLLPDIVDRMEQMVQALTALDKRFAALNHQSLANNLSFVVDIKGVPEYAGFPELVIDGAQKWAGLGVDIGQFFSEFDRLNKIPSKWVAETAGGMIGAIAEIADALRAPAPGRDSVKGMLGGEYLGYAAADLQNNPGALGGDDLRRLKATSDVAEQQRILASLKQDVDRRELRANGDEYYIEVKDNAHTARVKHSGGAQVDRLCAVVAKMNRDAPGPQRFAALSLASGRGFQELFLSGVGQIYIHFGLHIFVEGKHYTPEDIRALWDDHAGERAAQLLTKSKASATNYKNAGDLRPPTGV